MIKQPGQYFALLVALLVSGGCNIQLIKPNTDPFYDAVLMRNPRHPAALYGQGDAMLRQGRYAEAEKIFRQFVAVAPEQAQGQVALGKSYLEQRKFKEAREAFKKGAELQATPEAYLGWATAALMAGDSIQARELSQIIEKQFGAGTDLSRLRGDIEYVTGNVESALVHYRESLQKNPGQHDLQERIRDLEEYLTLPR